MCGCAKQGPLGHHPVVSRTPFRSAQSEGAQPANHGRRPHPLAGFAICTVSLNASATVQSRGPDNEEGDWRVEDLVIGVPAHEAGETIEDLAGALEFGSARLGEEIRCQLVLAHQQGLDDTLQRWESHPFRIHNHVLHSPDGITGKGHNVKALIRHAREVGTHLLLVDADFRSYPPMNLIRFVNVDRLARGGMALPLWPRPRGQGNSTDFLACPLIFAAFGAHIRQPLAGHMLLTKRMLANIDIESLPGDYGIDAALTIHALTQGLPVDQVMLTFPDHDAGGNSHGIMEDVANTMLTCLANLTVVNWRSDVAWPSNWWAGQPVQPATSRSLRGLIEQVVPFHQLQEFGPLFDASPIEVQRFWSSRLAGAVRRARAGGVLPAIVADLVGPFLVHAEYRRRMQVDLHGAEAYVSSLCASLAAAVS